MIDKPKNFPIYVAIYTINGEIDYNISMIVKVNKATMKNAHREIWNIPIRVINIDYEDISKKMWNLFLKIYVNHIILKLI